MQTRTINGIPLAYLDRGKGLPLLLAHGFPLDHTMWSQQVSVLAARCRVIAVDLRGFGRSGTGGDVSTMEQMADDLAALADALGLPHVVLGGLSMGGYVALAFARRHPQRLAGLVLCDTRAAADTPEAAAGREETAARVLREGTASLPETMLPKLFSPRSLERHLPVVAAARQTILSAPREGVAAAARGMARRHDATADLPHISCPTLVLVGEDDAISPPAEMKSLADAIPNARFVVIPQAGHMSPMEQPAAVSQAIDEFLSGVRS